MTTSRARASLLCGLLLSLGWAADTLAQLPAGYDQDTRSRIPEIQREQLDAEGRAIYDQVTGGERNGPLMGPAGVSLHMPQVARAMDILNQYLRYDSVIGRRYIEVAILVTAREFDQQYEWTFHEEDALEVAVPEDVIDAIKFDRAVESLPEKDRVIVEYGRQIFREHHLSQATWDRAVALFGQQGALEIAAIMGDYLLAAVLLHAVDQQLPAGMEPMMPSSPR